MDGVLVAVKDEIDCLPYPTTGKNITRSGIINGAKVVESYIRTGGKKQSESGFNQLQDGR
jgi:hypothetical protein